MAETKDTSAGTTNVNPASNVNVPPIATKTSRNSAGDKFKNNNNGR